MDPMTKPSIIKNAVERCFLNIAVTIFEIINKPTINPIPKQANIPIYSG